jgi:hypothetical protein
MLSFLVGELPNTKFLNKMLFIGGMVGEVKKTYGGLVFIY